MHCLELHWPYISSLKDSPCPCLSSQDPNLPKFAWQNIPSFNLFSFNNSCFNQYLFYHLKSVVVSTVASGILFPRFSTVEHITTISFLFLWHHSCCKKSSTWERKWTFKGWGYYFPCTLSSKSYLFPTTDYGLILQPVQS